MNRMKVMVLVAAFVASLMLAGITKAEMVNTTAELLNNKTAIAYIFSPPMSEMMYRLGVEEDRKFGLQPNCQLQYHVIPFAALVLQPIEFPEGKQHPTQGVWLTRYQLERCGDSKFYNALFFASSNGDAPISKPFYPGSTNADPVLVRDAMMTAVIGAMSRSGLKEYKDFDVFDMRVTEPAHDVVEGDKTFRGVWSEIWTFRVRGQMIDVPMTFIPDANGGGTTFTSGPDRQPAPKAPDATEKKLKKTKVSGSGNGPTSSNDEVSMLLRCEKPPGFLYQAKPAYPETARTAGITGKVFVSVLIGEDGRPIKAKVMKRIPEDCKDFDVVALKSVMESGYYPGILNGLPTKVWLTAPISFQLN